jgi:hypothetical protein
MRWAASRRLLPEPITSRSGLEFGTQARSGAAGTAQAPLGPVGTPLGPAEVPETPGRTPLLGISQNLKAPFDGERLRELRIHVIHLASSGPMALIAPMS